MDAIPKAMIDRLEAWARQKQAEYAGDMRAAPPADVIAAVDAIVAVEVIRLFERRFEALEQKAERLHAEQQEINAKLPQRCTHCGMGGNV